MSIQKLLFFIDSSDFEAAQKFCYHIQQGFPNFSKNAS